VIHKFIITLILFDPNPFVAFSTFFFFNHPTTTEIYTLSLHDALPISQLERRDRLLGAGDDRTLSGDRGQLFDRVVEDLRVLNGRSEEHTSELQSPCNLVCRLLLEKKKTSESAISQAWVLSARLSETARFPTGAPSKESPLDREVRPVEN